MTQILKTVADVRNFRDALNSKILGFVPTMGNLHDGHLSLMRIAQQHADVTLVSIFVNPTQFAPDEDLDAYPRTFEADLQKLQCIGVDAVFFPEEQVIYPHGRDSTLLIEMPAEMTDILCGLGRPTHFQGVATVVTKLFQIVSPDIAVFGEKDFQQLAIIRRLNEELFMHIEVLSGNIIREESGLALSSRNQYLSDEAREQATWLSKTLQMCRTRLLHGEPHQTVLADGRQTLNQQGIDVEYLDFRDTETLAQHPDDIKRGVLLVAGRIGSTRLIDNLRIA